MSKSRSLDGVLIKRAHSRETFTETQLTELAKCSDPENGYLYFAKNYAHIQHPVRGKLLFDPYPYQERLLHSYHNYRFNINMLPRQTGKCFSKETTVRIKNKNTGETREITVGEFFEMQKQNKK
jgi:hypothetical protein